jgi:hypothetical protein
MIRDSGNAEAGVVADPMELRGLEVAKTRIECPLRIAALEAEFHEPVMPYCSTLTCTDQHPKQLC